nr:hypothetical protein [uncultured Noviherbaspirillum sp.]
MGGHDPESGLAALVEFCSGFYALYLMIIEICAGRSAYFRQIFDLEPFCATEIVIVTASNVSQVVASTACQLSIDAAVRAKTKLARSRKYGK